MTIQRSHVQNPSPCALLPCHAVESLVAGQHTSQVSGTGSGGASAVVASSRPAGLTIHSVMTSSGSAYQNFQGRIMWVLHGRHVSLATRPWAAGCTTELLKRHCYAHAHTTRAWLPQCWPPAAWPEKLAQANCTR